MKKVLYNFIKGCVLLAVLLVGTPVFAQNSAAIDDLRNKIEQRNDQIKKLERDIANFQRQLSEVSQQKQGLERELAELDISRRKLSTDIALIQERIDTADLTIQQLSLEIQDTENRIEQNRNAIAIALRSIDEFDSRTLVETVLAEKRLSDAWTQAERLGQFQSRMKDDLGKLRDLKVEVEQKQEEVLSTKKDLVSLRSELADKRSLVDQQRNQQQSLIARTENEQQKYESLIAEKQRQKEAFQQELFEIESQLNIALDPSRIPTAQSGIFSWPLDNIFITQYFGRTVSAQRLYTSGTHNGVDFRAPRGTSVRTARQGIVQGVGNTDAVPGCYSYGKWILIKHDNGLSTLYAHLDLIKVKEGQSVERGEIIGYSGNTGYSTGPHLHFTVYASQGVRVQQYSSSINCKSAVIPIADRKAYLDPLEYLPQI